MKRSAALLLLLLTWLAPGQSQAPGVPRRTPFKIQSRWCASGVPADSGKVFGGEYFIVHDREILRVASSPDGRPLGDLSSFSLPLPVKAGPGDPLLRYAQGQLWMGLPAKGSEPGMSFMHFDFPTKTQETFATLPILCDSFEIDLDGNLLLFSAINLKDGTRSHVATATRGADTVRAVHAYPWHYGSNERARENSLWKSTITHKQDTNIIIYHPNIGKMFAYDLVTRAIRELRTPWKSVGIEEFKEASKSSPDLFRAEGYPGAFCIQFIPLNSNRVLIAYVLHEAEKPGTPVEQGQEPPHPEPPKQLPLKTYELDLSTGEVTEPVAREGMKLPLWATFEGDPIPLEAFLAGRRSVKPQAAPRGPGSQGRPHDPSGDHGPTSARKPERPNSPGLPRKP